MAHERQDIRDRIKSILDTAALTGINNWFNSRGVPLYQAELPIGLIYITEEEADNKDSAPRYYNRIARVRIEIISVANENFDNFLDDKAKEVEDLFFEKWTLSTDAKIENGLAFVQDFVLAATRMAMEEEGDNLISSLIMEWLCEYITQAPRSDAALLDDLKTVNVEYDLPGVGETKDAEDTIPDLDL